MYESLEQCMFGWDFAFHFHNLLSAFLFIVCFESVILNLTRISFLYTFTHILPLLPTFLHRFIILTHSFI